MINRIFSKFLFYHRAVV